LRTKAMTTRRPLAIATSPALAPMKTYSNPSITITVRDSHTPSDSSHSITTGDSSYSITAGDSSSSADDFPAVRTQTSRRKPPTWKGPGSTCGVSRGREKQRPVDTTCQPSLGNLSTADSPLLITAGDTNFSAGRQSSTTNARAYNWC